MKDKGPFYIVFQVLKVLLIKIFKMQPLDLLLLVVFISFYMSRYLFIQSFRTSFNIIWKKDLRSVVKVSCRFSLNMEFLKENFSFSINEKDRSYIITNYVTGRLPNEIKTLKNNPFLAFRPWNGQKFCIISIKCSISSYVGLKFSLMYFHDHCLLLLNVFLM